MLMTSVNANWKRIEKARKTEIQCITDNLLKNKPYYDNSFLQLFAYQPGASVSQPQP